MKSIPFWGGLTVWLFFSAKNVSHSEEGTRLCECILWEESYPILRRPDYLIILSSQKSFPFSGGPDYVVLISSHKSVPFWGELTLWLYFPATILSRSEGTWLYDYIFQPKFYPILRGPDYVIKPSSQKSIPFWGDLTMWLNFHAKILSHSEGTWLCDYTFQPKVYYILRKPDYVLILFSQKSIPFWGDLTLLLCPKEWNLSHSEETWLFDYTFQSKIVPIQWGPDMWF